MENRKCSKCKKEKPIAEFSYYKDNLNKKCNRCIENAKLFRIKNKGKERSCKECKEKVRKRNSEHYQKNREKILASKRSSYVKRKEAKRKEENKKHKIIKIVEQVKTKNNLINMSIELGIFLKTSLKVPLFSTDGKIGSTGYYREDITERELHQ